MWKTIGMWLVKAAVWAYGHPDEVKTAIKVVEEVKKAKESK